VFSCLALFLTLKMEVYLPQKHPLTSPVYKTLYPTLLIANTGGTLNLRFKSEIEFNSQLTVSVQDTVRECGDHV
jgi:hypothetical protein